jgi:methionine-rich copper-binding protein CopC
VRRLVLAAALAGLSGPAAAHAFLEAASPAAGQNLRAPSHVELHFSERLEPSFSAVTVSDEAGADVSAGTAIVLGTQMSLALKPLRPGRYRVVWHAVSVDTHRTEGKYNFLVVP